MVKKLGGASTKGWVESAIPPWLGLTVKSVWGVGGSGKIINKLHKSGSTLQNLVWPFNFFCSFALETMARMSKSF